MAARNTSPRPRTKPFWRVLFHNYGRFCHSMSYIEARSASNTLLVPQHSLCIVVCFVAYLCFPLIHITPSVWILAGLYRCEALCTNHPFRRPPLCPSIPTLPAVRSFAPCTLYHIPCVHPAQTASYVLSPRPLFHSPQNMSSQTASLVSCSKGSSETAEDIPSPCQKDVCNMLACLVSPQSKFSQQSAHKSTYANSPPG